jgi:hypothetical protein
MAAFNKSDLSHKVFFEDFEKHGTPDSVFALEDTKACLWRKTARKLAISIAKGLLLVLLACSVAWLVTQNRNLLKVASFIRLCYA